MVVYNLMILLEGSDGPFPPLPFFMEFRVRPQRLQTVSARHYKNIELRDYVKQYEIVVES